jgi:ribosomal protein S18 acetylase RimI-like enzyme
VANAATEPVLVDDLISLDELVTGAVLAKSVAYCFVVRNGRILGYCRTMLQQEVSSYDEYEWIWDASISKSRGSVGFLYVDPEYRSLGLGAALIAKAFDLLFERGCREIWGHTPVTALQARYRRWGSKRVGGVVVVSK